MWRKLPLGIGEATLEVRAVQSEQANAIAPREPASGSPVGDAPVLPDLLGRIVAGHAIGSVTADGAHDTRRCHDAIAARGAHAVVPPPRNARPWKPDTPGARARNEAPRVQASRPRVVAPLDGTPPSQPR